MAWEHTALKKPTPKSDRQASATSGVLEKGGLIERTYANNWSA